MRTSPTSPPVAFTFPCGNATFTSFRPFPQTGGEKLPEGDIQSENTHKKKDEQTETNGTEKDNSYKDRQTTSLKVERKKVKKQGRKEKRIHSHRGRQRGYSGK